MIIVNGVDVGYYLITNELGIVATEKSSNPARGYITPTSESRLLHAVVVNHEGEYWQTLKTQQELARLENIGIWATCNFKDYTGEAGL